MARALATLIFLKEGLFPLAIRESDRQEYIGALEKADDGDLYELVALFARRQREAILKAIGLEQQLQQSRHSVQIISSALQILKDRFSREKVKIEQVYEQAEKLFALVETRFTNLGKQLNLELRHVTPPGKNYCARNTSANNKSGERYFFRRQIVATAKELATLHISKSNRHGFDLQSQPKKPSSMSLAFTAMVAVILDCSQSPPSLTLRLRGKRAARTLLMCILRPQTCSNSTTSNRTAAQ